jgi:prevent-host-death family protein
MQSTTVTLTEFKQNLGEFINRASFRGERIVLLSHGKERAAIISLEDLHLLEAIQHQRGQETYQRQQQILLNEARQLREHMAEYQTGSTTILEEVREERLNDILDMR